MYSPTQELFYLQPGEVFVTGQGTTITTVLGSCVAVCMWDPIKKIGGMNHVVMPRLAEGEEPSTKYGNIATFILLDMMVKEGSKPSNIQCSVFGGASKLGQHEFTQAKLRVGAINIEVTLKVLEHLKMKIIAQNVGGERGRKIILNTEDGKIDMNYLKSFDFSKEIKEIKL
ncbi:MAG: chemotaxis protein CheD [SAR324 cluster bacterium]|nr:chemotaxis protein CheD [SAR324 cluster bacterium]